MVLAQVEGEFGSVGKRDICLGDEDGRTILVARAGSGIDAPRRFILAVNGIGDRSGHPLLP